MREKQKERDRKGGRGDFGAPARLFTSGGEDAFYSKMSRAREQKAIGRNEAMKPIHHIGPLRVGERVEEPPNF